MLKAVNTLVSMARCGAASGNRGNHSFIKRDGRCMFYYHMSPVCIADMNSRTVSYDHCGFHTSSTSRTISSYREAFSDYREIPRQQESDIGTAN